MWSGSTARRGVSLFERDGGLSDLRARSAPDHYDAVKHLSRRDS